MLFAWRPLTHSTSCSFSVPAAEGVFVGAPGC